MKNCANSDPTTTCRGGGRLERPRYFPRQLITPAEMNLGQDYFRNRLRLHNRMLHGWGVVCGALVCPDGEPWRVKVKPGYVLGPCGDEIAIDCEHVVDLRTCGLAGASGEPPEQSADPWCSEVYVKRELDRSLWVAVKYEERMARPVRAQPTGCGCDDDSCEYSRWCDGYVIGVLDACPQSHRGTPECVPLCDPGPNPTCPACCPDDPWVVLAEVKLDDDGTIDWIDNCSCRRLVASPGRFWWRCDDSQQMGPIVIDEVRFQGRAEPGGRTKVEVVGRNFVKEGATIELGSDVVIDNVLWAPPESVTFEVTIAPEARPGGRTLTIERADGIVAKRSNALTIPAARTRPSPAPPAPQAAAPAKKPATTRKAAAPQKKEPEETT
ncbi:MAG TPA: hypothetical protein VGC93_05675 [Thermoanaerobaculia bacterium]|jgi:hypothetical protein